MEMTARRRRARGRSIRSRLARAKLLRRRARAGGARRTATAAAAAAVSLAGSVSSATAAAPAGVAETVEVAAGSAGVSLAACDPHTPASEPRNYVDVRGTLFFTADDGVHGRELWKSDGTKAGTALVKDIQPGSSYYDDPSYLTDVGGTLFFTADDGVHGRELWKSDGTKAGTVLVKDIHPGTGGYYDDPSHLTDVGGHVVLHRRRRRPRPGAVEVGRHQGGHRPGQGHQSQDRRATTDYGPSALTDVGGTLFFTADDGTHGRELWKSDGTKAGTVLVKDIHPGGYGSEPRSALTDVGGTLFFTATTASTVGSCGSRTAPRRAPSWSRTSTPAAAATTTPRPPDRCRRDVVLHRRRRHPRSGAVEVRRHRGGHRPGQGHPPRHRRRLPTTARPP